MKTWGVTGIALILLAGIARAETGPRLDFFDAKSGGMGYAIIQYGRFDLYDAKSNWIGYGRIESGQGNLPDPNPNRIINLYDRKSNSIGYAKPGLGGQTLELFDARSSRLGTIKLR